jgi:hypothetical protein
VRSLTVLPVALAFLVFAAQADDEVPAFTTLACKTNCADITPPVIVEKPSPAFPAKYGHNTYSLGVTVGVYVEGLVKFRFVIGTDGHVHDIETIKLIGPQDFADIARAAVERRLYKPATRGGQPIDQISMVEYAFSVGAIGGARPQAMEVYDRAIATARDGRLDDAIMMLNDELARPELNFYERDSMWYALAMIHLQRRDLLAARAAINDATEFAPDTVPPSRRFDALRLRIKLEIALGEAAYADFHFNLLTKDKAFKADDPIVTLMDRFKKYLDATDEIPVTAGIPSVGPDASWQHPLYRHTFRFDTVAGKLDKFELWCRQGAIASPVVETAQWQVPDNWGNCSLIVYGAPGTTFLLHEAKA